MGLSKEERRKMMKAAMPNVTFVDYPDDEPGEWEGASMDLWWIDEPCSITARDVEEIHCKWAGKILR